MLDSKNEDPNYLVQTMPIMFETAFIPSTKHAKFLIAGGTSQRSLEQTSSARCFSYSDHKGVLVEVGHMHDSRFQFALVVLEGENCCALALGGLQ